MYFYNIFYRAVSYIGELATLLGLTIYLIFVPPFKSYRVLIQMQRVGPESFLISGLVAFFIGMIMALQMAYHHG